MIEHTTVRMSDDRIRDALAVFGPERAHHGMRAFPRVPFANRDNVCACFVGYAWEPEYGSVGDGFSHAFGVHWDALRVLSWAYEHQTKQLEAVATDWLAQQDAIAEVTQPGLVRASL